MQAGIIICSRANSQRIPNKPFVHFNGIPVIVHLVKRLLPTKLPIFIAVPHSDYELYYVVFRNFLEQFHQVHLVTGSASDPLARMNTVAAKHSLDTIVRITHDKIFVDPEAITTCLETFQGSDLDYLYSSKFTDGAGFEIMSSQALAKASERFQKVEHVGYAIRCVTDRITNLGSLEQHPIGHRLLIDYPEDVQLMKVILTTLGNDCTLKQVLEFLDNNPWASKLNRLPLITVYTCAYNAEKWIRKCMGSVAMQSVFGDLCEYLLIDDASTDKTSFFMTQFCSNYPNSKWLWNTENQGLASSSNKALSHARGKYILRLDADDYFTFRDSVELLKTAIESTTLDIIYPDNYFGSYKKIQSGSESHHVGGAIFRTRAANHIKFTEGLRGYEGYDFFKRAQSQLKIGYLNKPVFFYRQHKFSMSKTNLELREKIKEAIDAKVRCD